MSFYYDDFGDDFRDYYPRRRCEACDADTGRSNGYKCRECGHVLDDDEGCDCYYCDSNRAARIDKTTKEAVAAGRVARIAGILRSADISLRDKFKPFREYWLQGWDSADVEEQTIFAVPMEKK